MNGTEPLAWGAAFLIGFLGSSHCVGMCGGIVGALGLSTAPERRRDGRPDLALLAGYNSGRILSYVTAGALAGGLGAALAWAHLETPLRIVAALLLIALGLYLSGAWKILARLEAAGQGLWNRLQPLARPLLPVRHLHQAVALGALWGWLPCGLVYSTLAWAAASASPAGGALIMLCFGLGTFPALLATGLFAGELGRFARNAGIRAGSGALVAGFGLWTLWGALIHPGHDPGDNGAVHPHHSHYRQAAESGHG